MDFILGVLGCILKVIAAIIAAIFTGCVIFAIGAIIAITVIITMMCC